MRFPIIGLGASAGGLEAVTAFLRAVPPKSGAAYVVVQHLAPNRESLLVDLLARSCAMPVAEVVDGMSVAPDHVYVITPDRDLRLRGGVLRLSEPHGPRGHRMPIDVFFASLAEEYQQQGVGVILSGSGSDGTLGLMAIREGAGLTAAQDPTTATAPGMPRSAIDSELVDLVAPAKDLPAQILAALRATRRPRTDISRSDREGQLLDRVLALLKAQTGHDFSLYKKTTLYRRIERRMGLRRIAHLRDYVEFLQQNPGEGSLLLKELLIGVTRFFRDAEVWEQLRSEIVTRLLVPRPSGGVLRAWVPGCATGEEAYTLAMVFREALEKAGAAQPCTLQIFATDLNQAAIDHARRGIYPSGIAATMSPERLKRFFVPDERGGYRVTKDIREQVIFAPHNLLADPPFTKLDLLACRNLMIYLAPEVHESLLQRFHFSLNPGAILLLGSSESVGTATDLFAPLAGYGQLYQRLNAPLHPTKVGISFSATPTTPLVPLARNADPMAAHVIANLQNMVDQLLLQRYAPAAVLTTSTGDIMHISGKTGRYLEPAAGKANWNVLAMARPGLSSVISEVFYDAQRRQATVTLTATQIGDDGELRGVDITVQPLAEPPTMKGMVLIVFTDVTVPVTSTGQDDRAERQSERLKTMELALQAAREELQTTREEMQTSREELTSTNEELQSTNEELTTSAEELRTMNEELVRARSAAESALARYTDLFDSAPVGYFTIDRDGMITQANLAGTELLDLGRDRPAGGRLALFVIEAERGLFIECLERAFTTHDQHTCEVGLWRDKGAPRRVRISALAGEDARTCRVVVADVSEIRQAQAALGESEERYRMLWETTTDAIIVLDERSVIRYANTAVRTVFGYDQAEIVGRDLALLQPEHLRNKHLQGLARYLATHEKRLNWRATQTTALHRDGHEFPIEISFSHVTIGGKALFAGFLRDVTERVRAEEALRESEERYRRIVENAHEGIWTIDAQGCTTFTNTRMAEMLGYTVAEMKGRHLSDFMDAEGWVAAQRSLVERAQGRAETKEMRYRRKDGSDLWALIAASPILAADGTFQGATALVTDVTDRRRMEEELRHAQKMEAVGRLAGGIAHDFNNQLTVIEGYGTLAMGRSKDHQLTKCLAYIVSAAGRSAALVRQLLTFSRKGHHTLVPVDLHRLIDEVVEMLSRSVPKNIRLERDLRAVDPMVEGDVSLLQNVLLNLALNARDAMPNGGELCYATDLLELDAQRAARLGGGLPSGRYLRLTVSDTGQGMNEEVQRHLFEPFFSTKAPGQGTGLGLASVYGTIIQHHGGIEVESAIGRGSSFRLFLPSAVAGVDKPAHESLVLQPSAVPGSGSILVIDDEEVVASLIADTLEGSGYRVHCAHDGAQALEHYRSHWADIDLILLDMNMPVMSGPEAFTALRAINPQAKVLVISGYSEGRGVEEVMRGGAQAFLAKPFRPDLLLEQVAQILGAKHG